MGALASRDPLGFSQHVYAENKTQQSKKSFPDLRLEDSPANILEKQCCDWPGHYDVTPSGHVQPESRQVGGASFFIH